MSVHPDEATLLRSVVGELPAGRQANVRRHVARCPSCLAESAATKKLHERLSAAGDALAFATGDAFVARPVSWRHERGGNGSAVKAMAAALARLESEKEGLLAAIESSPSNAAASRDLANAACRLAVAHVLEEGVSDDPSPRLADFAAFVVGLGVKGEGVRAGEAEDVLPSGQLRVLAHLVLGNWRLFTGHPENAQADFAACWTELGTFDAPEHLCAWVEVGESLRRSYEGRAVEGRLLAERALETFERYGLDRGVIRARHARAVALYTAGEFREAQRLFRAVIESRDATTLDRARGVSGAAFCLAARGRFHEAAKEYSRVRRKLRGEGAMVEQYLLQGEMKLALGTAGRWHLRADSLVTFSLPEAGGAFHARRVAEEIVKVVSEEGLERAKELLGKINSDPSRGYAYLYACQLAMPKTSSAPAMYVEFAKAVTGAAYGPFDPSQVVSSEQVRGEGALIESISLNILGKPTEARMAAQYARVSFAKAGEDSFALALVDYFEGSAASFATDYAGCSKALRSAHDGFRLFGQEQWQGRAQAALGTLLMNRGSAASAVRFFDEALLNLHPDRDEVSYSSTFANRCYALVRLNRLDAAKAAYAKALMMARRLEMKVTLLAIRYGLAIIDLQKGNLPRALRSFERLSRDACGISDRVLSAELRIAECLGRMGRSEGMVACVERIRSSADADVLESDPGLRELFASIENRSVNYELLAHVAHFAEARDRGFRAAYKPFHIVTNGR